jgi:hypothetical protein
MCQAVFWSREEVSPSANFHQLWLRLKLRCSLEYFTGAYSDPDETSTATGTGHIYILVFFILMATSFGLFYNHQAILQKYKAYEVQFM